MPIIELQKRMYERGRIRIGQKSAKGAPQKLDRFRFTSAAKENLLPIAAAYGGDVVEWAPADGRKQWEVVTDSARLPILVPPNPVSQWLELWSGGGCQRRCDGLRDVISDSPCLCDPDPEKRACKPTTRLNVVLRDMPGIGVWRLESHGWNAAVELPGLAEFVMRADGMVPAFLTLEERVTKRDGKTNRFMVPGIDVEVTPSQLLAGQTSPAAAVTGNQAPALTTGQADVPDYAAEADACTELACWREVWERAKAAGHLTEALKAQLTRAGERIATQQQALPAALIPPAVDANPDELWMSIVGKCPAGWTTAQLENDFTEYTGGVAPADATATDMAGYLAQLKAGAR